MGLLEVLTIVFVVLKLTSIIDWSWWLVLLPEIIAIGLYILWVIFVGSLFTVSVKSSMKRFK